MRLHRIALIVQHRGMKNALIYVLSAIVGVVTFDATLTPFFSALMSEFGVHPETWARPVAQTIRDMFANDRIRYGLFGGLGAYAGIFAKVWWESRRPKK